MVFNRFNLFLLLIKTNILLQITFSIYIDDGLVSILYPAIFDNRSKFDKISAVYFAKFWIDTDFKEFVLTRKICILKPFSYFGKEGFCTYLRFLPPHFCEYMGRGSFMVNQKTFKNAEGPSKSIVIEKNKWFNLLLFLIF